MRAVLKLALGAALVLPTQAHALTLEFITYNGFQDAVNAFHRLGLIFSDSGFVILAASMIAVTCVGAAIKFGVEGLGRGGQGAHPMSLFMPFLIGTVLFWGAVIPKGTLQIYDPVKNRTEAVPDIPAVIVLLAGGLSAIEKGMTTMVDTASANPYGDDVGGISYSLIMSAVKASTKNTNLDRSLGQYYKDCGMTAIGSGYNGATLNELIYGAAGTDLYAAFQKWNHPSWPTVWFPDGNDGGTTGTCADAWSYLQTKLGANISTTMNPMMREACEGAGFDWDNANEAAACQTSMQRMAANHQFGTATPDVVLRAYTMADAMSVAMQDPDFNVGINALVNRQMLSEAFGASAAMNQWIPRLRGLMLAIAVGVTPICLVFVATPLVLRALSVVVGLYIWLALWGICDVIANQMMMDAAYDAFAHARDNNLGFLSIMQAPEGAIAALGVYGKARTMGMILATVLSGGLFKLSSSYAFTSMGQQWQGDFNQGGEAAGKQRLQVEQQAGMQDQLIRAPGTVGRLEQGGFGLNAAAANYGEQTNLARVDYLQGVSGNNLGGLAYQAGTIGAGTEVGNQWGMAEAAGKMNMPLGPAASAIAQAGTVGSAGGTMGARNRAEANVPGGYFEAASFEGQNRIAGVEVQQGFAREFEDKGQADGIGAIARQNQASFGGVLDATDGRPEVARDMYGAGTSEQIGRLDTYRDRFGFDPRQVGAAQGVDAAVSTGATEATLRNRGIEAMTAGAQYGKEQSAVIGTTAQQLGGGSVSPVADVTGRNQLAGDFGRATAQQKMADFLFGDSTADLAQLHERGASVFSGTLSGDAARRVVDWSEQNGRIPSDHADALRAKADKGFSVAVGFGEDGQIASFNFDGRYSGQVGATHDDTVGMNYGRGDSTTLGDSTAVRQGMSMRGENEADVLQEFIRKNEGRPVLDRTDSVAVTNAYVERLRSEGQGANAQHGGAVNTAGKAGWGTNANASNGGRGVGGAGGGAGKGGGVGSVIQAVTGLNVGVSTDRSASDNWSVQNDAAFQKFNGSIPGNYAAALQQTENLYGPRESWEGEKKVEAERNWAERWAVMNATPYNEMKAKIENDTANAVRDAQEGGFYTRLGDKIGDIYDAAKDKLKPW